MGTPEVSERLEALVQRAAAKRSIHSVVVALQVADTPIAAAAGGHADEAETTPMTTATPYYLASITKMYTAAVTMKLAATGALDLDSPMTAYVPADVVRGIHVIDGVDHSTRITVTQLLGQTSGLADYFEGAPDGEVSLAKQLASGRDRGLDLDEMLDIVRRLEPEFAPGARDGRRAHYSDTNYALLGAVIEQVTERPLVESFQEMIFDPYGLTQTWVFDHTVEQPKPATLFSKDRPIDIPLAMSAFVPDGAMVSTVGDSLRFLDAFFRGDLLEPGQLDDMTRRWNRIFFPLRYGAGLMQFRLPRWMSPFTAPPELIGHSGSTGSFAFYNPARTAFVAGTVNQMDNPGRPYRLMTQVMRLLD